MGLPARIFLKHYCQLPLCGSPNKANHISMPEAMPNTEAAKPSESRNNHTAAAVLNSAEPDGLVCNKFQPTLITRRHIITQMYMAKPKTGYMLLLLCQIHIKAYLAMLKPPKQLPVQHALLTSHCGSD